MMTVTAYLGLGANLGDRLANMREAVRLLEAHGSCRVTARSPVYETKPIGIEDQPDFLNAVIAIETSLGPEALLDLCKSIENRLGRVRTNKWGPRVIDLDILLCGEAVVQQEGLTIPHPEAVNRAFVLVPLADIAPEIEVAPGLTAREAAERVGSGGVQRVDETL